jgi:uncharacterized HhH-GPD family protein
VQLDALGASNCTEKRRMRAGSVSAVTATFYITGDEKADRLLHDSPLALLLGMLLDQQVPMEWAFGAPSTLHDRLGHLDATKIAEMDLDEFVTICCEKPAIHRFPGSMGKRIHTVCRIVADEYDGDAANIWRDTKTGDELYQRLRKLPGYGDEKAQIFIAVLGKRRGVRPKGWKESASVFGDDIRRTVADADTREHLLEVRAFKKLQKAQAKGKADPPV